MVILKCTLQTGQSAGTKEFVATFITCRFNLSWDNLTRKGKCPFVLIMWLAVEQWITSLVSRVAALMSECSSRFVFKNLPGLPGRLSLKWVSENVLGSKAVSVTHSASSLWYRLVLTRKMLSPHTQQLITCLLLVLVGSGNSVYKADFCPRRTQPRPCWV